MSGYTPMQIEIMRTILRIGIRNQNRRIVPPDLPNYTAEGEFDCSICLEKIKLGDQIKILPCSNTVNHKYHSKCIDPWLEEKNTCPQCRAIIH